MNAPSKRASAPAASTAGADQPETTEKPEWPKLVHAYRRQPHLVHNPRTGLDEEKPVEVMFMGEKVLFKANEAGHVVAEVKNPATYKRLTEEIPEAYIAYADGDNLPTTPIVNAEHKHENKARPAGEFVLEGVDAKGEPMFKVLDDMDDDALRAFAASVHIDADALPGALSGTTLMRCIYNLLAGGAN